MLTPYGAVLCLMYIDYSKSVKECQKKDELVPSPEHKLLWCGEGDSHLFYTTIYL